MHGQNDTFEMVKIFVLKDINQSNKCRNQVNLAIEVPVVITV